MADVEIYSSTKEMLRAAVDASHAEVLTGTVAFAFTGSEGTEPDSGAYTAGTWFSEEQTVEDINDKFVRAYLGQILVSGVGGGGDVELAEGVYFAWVRVSLPDGQAPVKLAGKVTVL